MPHAGCCKYWGLAVLLSCCGRDGFRTADDSSEATGPVLIGRANTPSSFATDDARAYWDGPNHTAIWTAELSGAEQRQVVSDQALIKHIEADAGDVFWVMHDASASGIPPDVVFTNDVKLMRQGPGDPKPQELYVTVGGLPGGLALSNDHVVLAMVRTGNVTQNSGTLVALPRGGGEPRILASELPFPSAPALVQSTLYWMNGVGTDVDFGTYEDGSLHSMSLSGDSVRTLATGLDNLTDFAVGDRLYFVTDPDLSATLFSCPLAGCGESNADASEVASRALEVWTHPWALAADAQGLYYAEFLEPAADILWVPAQRTEPVVLATARSCPRHLASTSDSVLWVEQCEESPEATIWRVDKCAAGGCPQ